MSYPCNSNIHSNDVDSSTESNPSVAQPQMDASGDAESSSPHTVIRGETITHDYLEHIDPDTAHIDWLAFTLKYDQLHTTLQYLKIFLQNVFQIPAESWLDTKSGWNGYSKRINIGKSGLLAYGGESQKDSIHIEINGHGCSFVKDWPMLALLGQEEGWKITRVDLAYDDFEGKTANIELAKQWFEDGLFNANGRPPKAKFIDDMGSGEGKTFYIGNRKNGKLLRMYEKGREQGDPNSPWFRVELELKNKGRVVPWEVLVMAGQYLAGSYKALNFISLKQCKLKTIQKASKITYESMTKWVKQAAGKSINVMTEVNGGDVFTVFNQIVRPGIPTRLVDYADHLPTAEVKES